MMKIDKDMHEIIKLVAVGCLALSTLGCFYRGDLVTPLIVAAILAVTFIFVD